MSEIRIQQNRNLPDIVCKLGENAHFDPIWLRQYFDECISQGTVFKDNETIQVGWGILMLRDNGRNELIAHEPDFVSMPIQWMDSVTNTIRFLSLQRSVCDLIDAGLEVPSLRQACVCRNFSKSSEISLKREPDEENYSGWVLDFRDSDGTEEEMKSLYEVGINDHRLIPFFGLPASASVLINSQLIQIEFNGLKATSDKDPFLKKLLASWS
ncbi:MAG: hypothetical protein AAFX93_12295 [Verrucomicrobiota bacterium]